MRIDILGRNVNIDLQKNQQRKVDFPENRCKKRNSIGNNLETDDPNGCFS